MFGTTVHYFGNEPGGFLDALRAAIDAGGNFGIDGLLGALGIQVTVTDDGTETGTDGGTETGTGTGDGTETGTDDGTETGTDDGRGADGNGNNVAGAEGPEDRSIGDDDSKRVGAAVGVVAAGLALVLFTVILVAGRRRQRSEKVVDGAVAHQQFTDDGYTDDDEAVAYDKNIAHVVSEDDDSVVIRWGEEKSGDQPIYEQPIESILSSDDMKYAENHSCSSPSCRICAMKAEEGVGVRFIATPRSSTTPVSLSRESRSYESNDTVDL
jgi:hypothetical protein